MKQIELSKFEGKLVVLKHERNNVIMVCEERNDDLFEAKQRVQVKASYLYSVFQTYQFLIGKRK